uniref:F-box domain-containing protein n=1 Tax=Kalanchoe fedtschenkoi TaxID=63787 RepID=A0A7N0TQ10_KALFE
MACELYPWERLSHLSESDRWGSKVDKLDLDYEYRNLKIQMTGDGANSEVRGGYNVLEVLPVDPFGMGIKSTLSDQIYAAWNSWTEDEYFGSSGDSDNLSVDDEGSYYDILPRNVEELLSYAVASICSFSNQADVASQMAYSDDGVLDALSYDDSLPENVEELINHALESTDGEGDGVHNAFFFALGYLGVKDLLSVQGVCKSLNDAVKKDSLLWRNIYIGAELSSKISDDNLLQLTSRADGTLQSLTLKRCARITDVGLARVLESNPEITRLSVPNCTRLTIEGVVSSLKNFMLVAKPGLKHLRIAGLYGVTREHIDVLKSILDSDQHTKPRPHKPVFFHTARRSLDCPDDRALDIDICPQCQESRLVYDCPGESCRSKNHTLVQCRGCQNCIPRCFMCGGCITNCHYTETFLLDNLCWDCVLRARSKDKKEETDGHGVKCMIFIHEVHCEFCSFD